MKDVFHVSNVEKVIGNLTKNFRVMQNQLGLSESLKMHIINDHLEDYFELSGRSLLPDSDEVVEATHSRLRIFEERHNYKINQKGTPM